MKERRKEGEEVIRKDVEGVSIFFTSTKDLSVFIYYC